jgi:hypothetical protein
LTHVVVRGDAEIHARFDLGREKNTRRSA